MHFDDRLATVLRLHADGTAVARAQFRQLVDLLGTRPVDARGVQVDAAYARLADLTRTIPASVRAGILRDTGLRLRSPRLVAALATGENQVAEAVLWRADLAEEQWLDLIPALAPATRALLGGRRDFGPRTRELLDRLGVRGRGLPPIQQAEANQPEPIRAAQFTPPAAGAQADEAAIEVVPPAPASPTDESIGALVKRIEAYRRAREVVDAAPASDSPRLPLGEDHILHVPAHLRAFDFATDGNGRIVWSDPGAAPMAVGMALASPDIASPAMLAALRRHQPLRATQLELAGAPAIAGHWQVDATPEFDPLTGRFAGYRGRMRRAPSPAANAPQPAPRDSEADRIRQMLHELRTPVNAIQGFAEVIQQQLFGPTPHEYRALAAGIAGDAARMLAAFEELERLAKLDSGALDLEAGETELSSCVESIVAQLAAYTRSRGSGFALRIEDAPFEVPLARIEAERIVWRLLATLAGTAAPGEQLKLRLRRRGERIRLSVALPATLAERDDKALFSAAAGAVPQVIAAGVFGVGFALRLVAAEARAAGGNLERRGERLRLELPGLTGSISGHSEDGGRSAA